MGELLTIWQKNSSYFESKKLSQIIGTAGDGVIEHEKTFTELRELFSFLPTEILIRYIEDCLSGFEKSGFALQDLINEVGARLGFAVEHGRYRGSHGKNGYDGLWQASAKAIIMESKTTDTYRINLDTLNGYKTQLESDRPELVGKLSILIVVGRQDTGDLEAQIRGSKYAWDIRLISIDSLIKLLRLRENFNDSRTFQQIYEVLRPQEYTKLDRMIDLIFLPVQDAELESIEATQQTEDSEASEITSESQKDGRVNFYSDCVQKLGKSRHINFLQKGRTLYSSGKTGVIVCISKEYSESKEKRHYWFAYHSYFKDNLDPFEERYLLYGCGSADYSFLLPLDLIETHKSGMSQTERKNGSVYWHIRIYRNSDGKAYLQISKDKRINITEYRLL